MRLEDLLNGETSRLRRRPDNHRDLHPSKEVVKLEDFLIEDINQHKGDLEEEIMKLRGELEEEQSLNKALRTALRGPVLSQPRLSLLLLPPQVQELIEELAKAEAEILCLEKKVEDLKVGVYEERKATEERKADATSWKKSLQRQNHLPCETRKNDLKHRSVSHNYVELEKESLKNLRRVSTASTTELLRASPPMFEDELSESKKMHTRRTRIIPARVFQEGVDGRANEASEELTRCLIDIYLKLNKASRDKEGSTTVPNLSLQFTKSSSFNRSRHTSMHPYNHRASNLDPYGILFDSDATIRDIGAYKSFIHIMRGSVDVSRLSDCSTELVKLRVSIEKLRDADLSFLTYKQKLAFWINVFNGCAFLEHGLPSSQTKLVALMKKASLNVGGTVLKALDIESLIFQGRSESQSCSMDENEEKIRDKYALKRSEPNVAFALCRGTWSSPALRIYTPDEILEDLERSKAEYLAASIGVSSKGKIVVPKLLQLHVRGFTDDMESALEWMYHQLPRGASIRDVVAERLCRKAQVPASKLVEVQPYEYEFRYLFPVS